MKSHRLSILPKNSKRQYVTMHNMTLDEFFVYMDQHPQIAAEFEHNIKQDYQRDDIPPPLSILQVWKKNLYRFKNMRIFLLLHKQHYVGSYRIHPINVDGQKYFKISVVYIVPQYRRHGLASKMLAAVLHKRCFLGVKRDNKKAYHLYTKLGFQKYRQDEREIEMTNE